MKIVLKLTPLKRDSNQGKKEAAIILNFLSVQILLIFKV